VSASADLARHKPPYVRHASQDGSGPDAPKHLSAKGMWRLEAAGPWPRGGPVQYDAPYLLRHVPSGRYLALAADTGRSVVGGETVYDAVLLPRPPDHHGEKNFVFHLHPAAPPGGGEDTSAVVQKHASVFLRCRALGTNAPVQLSSPAGSVKSPDKPSSLTLLFTTVERPEDAFLLFPVAEVESQAVRLIASYPRWVDRYTSVVAALGQTYDAAGRAETEIPFLGHQLALIGEVLSELILDLILGDQDRATDSALEVTGPSDKVLQHMALETKLVDRIFAAIDAPLNAPPNRALSLQSDLKVRARGRPPTRSPLTHPSLPTRPAPSPTPASPWSRSATSCASAPSTSSSRTTPRPSCTSPAGRASGSAVGRGCRGRTR